VQQALTNAIRHSNATTIAVHLTRSADALSLRVEDDGDGFDPATVSSDRFGLLGMRERARLLGGTLMVESAPAQGTVIDVRIPLNDS
jgi:signal transduction histidine kinase